MTCPKCASNLVDGSKQCNICFATLSAPTSPQTMPAGVNASRTYPQSSPSPQPPQFGPTHSANQYAPPNYAVNANRQQKRSGGATALGVFGISGGTLTLILVLFRVGAQAFNASTMHYGNQGAASVSQPYMQQNTSGPQANVTPGFPPAGVNNGMRPGFGPAPSFGGGAPSAQMNTQHQQIQDRMNESQRRLQESMDANRQQMHNRMEENQKRLQEDMAANQQQMQQRMEEMNARTRASMPSNFGPGQMHGPGFGGPQGFPGPMGPGSMPGFGGGIR